MTTTHADDPSTHDTAATPPLCAAILAVLNLFAHTTGTVAIDARTVAGITRRRLEVPGGQAWHHLPPQVLELLEDNASWHLRINPVSVAGGRREALPVLYASWRPAPIFDPVAVAGRGQYRMPEKDAAVVAAALADFPRPSVLIDGWTEVAAMWALAEPLDLRKDPSVALDLLRRLAVRLGADLEAAETLDVLLPLCGAVRGVSAVDTPVVRILEADASRVYDLGTIERALADNSGATTKGATS